jgi:hypothetical protein
MSIIEFRLQFRVGWRTALILCDNIDAMSVASRNI